MISSIFGKTKPINFIILLGFLFFLYWIVQYQLFQNAFSASEMVLETIVLSILLFSVFIVDFIVKRNKLTANNSFAMLYFTLFFLVFPEVFRDSNAILANLFLLLAIRRLLSIKSLKEIKLKIFDATLWILVASLFYDWAVLFIAMVLIIISVYEPRNSKNWLAILSAFISFSLLTAMVFLSTNNESYLLEHYNFKMGNTRSYFTNIKLGIYVLINVGLIVWSFWKYNTSGIGKIVTLQIAALLFGIGLLISILNSTKDSYAITITFLPSVIFMCNYLESIKKHNVLEMILITSILIPILVFSFKLFEI